MQQINTRSSFYIAKVYAVQIQIQLRFMNQENVSQKINF